MADCSRIRKFADAADYTKNFIVRSEIDKYLPGGKHFIDEAEITRLPTLPLHGQAFGLTR